MATVPSLVAKRIREIREGKKISRQALADRLNSLNATRLQARRTTRLQVWRIETGATNVSADVAARFADALGVDVATLYRSKRRAA